MHEVLDTYFLCKRLRRDFVRDTSRCGSKFELGLEGALYVVKLLASCHVLAHRAELYEGNYQQPAYI